MIINYTNYYDQFQIIGLSPILNYQGTVQYATIITGQAYIVIGRSKNFIVTGRDANFTVTGRTKDFKLE